MSNENAVKITANAKVLSVGDTFSGISKAGKEYRLCLVVMDIEGYGIHEVTVFNDKVDLVSTEKEFQLVFSLASNSYQDKKTGATKYMTKINAIFLNNKGGYKPKQETKQNNANELNDDFDALFADDIPF